jgi:excisionase family DNA binding protein
LPGFLATIPALLSVSTVARLLGCSDRTVRRRIDDRSLPAVRDHGRMMIREDELLDYIEQLERVSPAPARSRRRGKRDYDFLRD